MSGLFQPVIELFKSWTISSPPVPDVSSSRSRSRSSQGHPSGPASNLSAVMATAAAASASSRAVSSGKMTKVCQNLSSFHQDHQEQIAFQIRENQIQRCRRYRNKIIIEKGQILFDQAREVILIPYKRNYPHRSEEFLLGKLQLKPKFCQQVEACYQELIDDEIELLVERYAHSRVGNSEDTYQAIFDVLIGEQNIGALLLISCRINTAMVNILIQSLSRANTIEELGLCHNEIDEQGAAALEAFGLENRTITKIDLSGNAGCSLNTINRLLNIGALRRERMQALSPASAASPSVASSSVSSAPPSQEPPSSSSGMKRTMSRTQSHLRLSDSLKGKIQTLGPLPSEDGSKDEGERKAEAVRTVANFSEIGGDPTSQEASIAQSLLFTGVRKAVRTVPKKGLRVRFQTGIADSNSVKPAAAQQAGVAPFTRVDGKGVVTGPG